MATQLQLGELVVKVEFKDIRNVHLSVHPPAGRVSISAPRHMSADTVRVFAISKLEWINRQRNKILRQDRESEREFTDLESHFVWGKRYLLSIVVRDEPSAVELRHNKLLLHVRPGTPTEKRAAILERWHRGLVRDAVPDLIAKWEPRLKVKIDRFFVQRMKTKWGSCNQAGRSIRLNTDLARKPRECLEYIVVHEMCHLLEPTHNTRFVALMDRVMPRWHGHREVLNRLPLRHDDWEY